MTSTIEGPMRAVLGVILRASNWPPRPRATRNRWRQDRWRESYRQGLGRAGHRDDAHRAAWPLAVRVSWLCSSRSPLLVGRRLASRPPSVGHGSPKGALLANNALKKLSERLRLGHRDDRSTMRLERPDLG